MATSSSSSKTLTTHGKWRKPTRNVTRNVERFEGVRTPRPQIRYRLDFSGVTRHCDPGEAETIREAQRSTCDRADVLTGLQVEGSSELGRDRRSVLCTTCGAEKPTRDPRGGERNR
jgi:hypothetical protein